MNGRPSSSRTAAFSLVEVVIALGILSTSILVLVGLLAPSMRSIGDILQDDENRRIVGALNTRLQNEGLATVYAWVKTGKDLSAYSYAADPVEFAGSGTASAPKPLPSAQGSGIVGRDYIIATGVRTQDDSLLSEDLKALAGQVFLVRLKVSPLNPVAAEALPASVTDYREAHLAVQVQMTPQNDPQAIPFVYNTLILR
jgi:hypothetical protein